jgi:GT2 family glycosyltransferase
MTEEFPLVTIITGTYNQPDLTLAFLDSVTKITYPNYEIIVYDNASEIRKPAIIKEKYPGITLLEYKENLGFAGGNNAAIRSAKGKYILLINNDTEVDPGFLQPLVSKLVTDPSVGVVSPKIRYFFTPDIIQFAGYTAIHPITIRNHGVGFGEKDNGQYDRDYYTEYSCGTAMLLPIEVIRKVGLMADIFFLYYEEIDWIQRIKDAGYKMAYVHNSLVFHKDSMTIGVMSPYKTYFVNRNRILFMRRNIHGLQYILAIIYQLFIAVPKNMLVYLFKGQFKLFVAYKNAIGWHFSNAFNADIHKNISLN